MELLIWPTRRALLFLRAGVSDQISRAGRSAAGLCESAVKLCGLAARKAGGAIAQPFVRRARLPGAGGVLSGPWPTLDHP